MLDHRDRNQWVAKNDSFRFQAIAYATERDPSTVVKFLY